MINQTISVIDKCYRYIYTCISVCFDNNSISWLGLYEITNVDLSIVAFIDNNNSLFNHIHDFDCLIIEYKYIEYIDKCYR